MLIGEAYSISMLLVNREAQPMSGIRLSVEATAHVDGNPVPVALSVGSAVEPATAAAASQTPRTIALPDIPVDGTVVTPLVLCVDQTHGACNVTVKVLPARVARAGRRGAAVAG